MQIADNLVVEGTISSTGNITIPSGSTITDAIQNGNAQCTTALVANTNTTLANITGLSVNVTAGGTYNVRAHLNGSTNASGGIKVAFSGSGNATSSNVTTWNWNGTTLNAVTNQTTWGSAITSGNVAFTDIVVEGAIVVNAGGNITLAAAQNAAFAGNTTIAAGSTMTVSRVS